MGKDYAEYLSSTTKRQRIFNYYWNLVYLTKKSYFSMTEEDRANYFADTSEPVKTYTLAEAIERSKELARAKHALAQGNELQHVG